MNDMIKKVIAISVIVLLLPLIACTQPAPGELLKSDKKRITSPDVSTSEQALLVEGNSAFAFELHKALRGKEGNLLDCPVASHWRWR